MGIFIFYHSTKTYFPQGPPLGGVQKVLLCYFRQTRAGWLSDFTPCVQRFHSEEILSEGAEILSGTPKFECGGFACDCRYDKIVLFKNAYDSSRVPWIHPRKVLCSLCGEIAWRGKPWRTRPSRQRRRASNFLVRAGYRYQGQKCRLVPVW